MVSSEVSEKSDKKNSQHLQPKIVTNLLPVCPPLTSIHPPPYLCYDPCRCIDIETALALEAFEQSHDPLTRRAVSARGSYYCRPSQANRNLSNDLQLKNGGIHSLDRHAQGCSRPRAMLQNLLGGTLNTRVVPCVLEDSPQKQNLTMNVSAPPFQY